MHVSSIYEFQRKASLFAFKTSGPRIANADKCFGQCQDSFHLQERRLKRLITLGGLEIGIQHQIVKHWSWATPNDPPPPPPPKKKKKKKKRKSLNSSNRPGWKNWSHCDLKTSSLYRYLSKVWKPNCQVFYLWLFCWYCSFAMCIPVRTNIHGSVAFPVLLPIDKRKIHIIIET